ncbi:hypothetical protein BSU04_32055 [Caballeronia sordidicola]|uniref:Uncharacterized protein n=1 Tax=Caballeronia sordidicola TaxID=196367 RepID=A0A226WTD0_CABSO|nr:hypothetical protein BSU04_32055 [Caballeronia sordidicola]
MSTPSIIALAKSSASSLHTKSSLNSSKISLPVLHFKLETAQQFHSLVS